MDEIAPENYNIAQNKISDHDINDKSTHPKSQDFSNQLALVNSSTEEPINHDDCKDRSNKARCNYEQQQQQQKGQSDLSSELKSLDWEALQSKFNSTMQERDEEEKKIIERFDKLVAVREIS